eukprot:14505782-Alexandrium_andersonii.AAC.1
MSVYQQEVDRVPNVKRHELTILPEAWNKLRMQNISGSLALELFKPALAEAELTWASATEVGASSVSYTHLRAHETSAHL